jgi:hypothetical protein
MKLGRRRSAAVVAVAAGEIAEIAVAEAVVADGATVIKIIFPQAILIVPIRTRIGSADAIALP